MADLVPLSIKVPETIPEALADLAERSGMTRNAYLRRALEELVEEQIVYHVSYQRTSESASGGGKLRSKEMSKDGIRKTFS